MQTEHVKCSTWYFLSEEVKLERQSVGVIEQIRTASRDITAPQRLATLCANEVEPTEIIAFTQGLLFSIGTIYGKELGGDDGVTVLKGEVHMRKSPRDITGWRRTLHLKH